MKQVTFTLLVALMSFSGTIFAVGDTDFAGGTGIQGDPWQIKTAVQLDNVRNNLSNTEMTYYKLMNDIDLKDIAATNNWVPYRDSKASTGAYMDFDGNGFVIKNMHIENQAANYQSFVGFNLGKIKNLGLVNVYINCPAVGGMGAFAGYVGAATPAGSDFKTGAIENCFATGYLSSGGGTVAGIAGNIGRPSNNGVPSYIKNCFFSGELYNAYGGGSATVRTGGVVGVVWANATESNNTIAPVQNCYATGYFHAKKGRVGGIVGETELTIQNSISYADLEEETGTPNSMGSIVGWCDNNTKWGKVENCWAFDEAKMKRGGEWITATNFTTPATGVISPVDGTLKDAAYLSAAINYYSGLSFPMAGEGAVWAQQLQNSKYPQLLWVMSRSDASEIDGLTNVPSIQTALQATHANAPVVFAVGNLLVFKQVNEPYHVSVYDAKGALLKSFEQTEDGASIVLSDHTQLLLVRMINQSGAVVSKKLIKD